MFGPLFKHIKSICIENKVTVRYHYTPIVVVFQSISRIRLFATPMDRSTPGFPVLRYLLEFAQTHVHWVGDAIQPSHSLSSPSPPALKLSLLQGLFQWVSSSYQVAKIIQDTEHQMLERRWSNKDCHSVLVGMRSGTATVEDSLPVHMIQQLPSLLNCPKELKLLSTQKPVHDCL